MKDYKYQQTKLLNNGWDSFLLSSGNTVYGKLDMQWNKTTKCLTALAMLD